METLKLRVPEPVLVTLKFAVGGFGPGWVPEKLMLDGEIESTGVAAGRAYAEM